MRVERTFAHCERWMDIMRRAYSGPVLSLPDALSGADEPHTVRMQGKHEKRPWNGSHSMASVIGGSQKKEKLEDDPIKLELF